MKQYFECHITMQCNDVGKVEKDVIDIGWKFSCIDGDPILGDGVKCYATKHFSVKEPAEKVIDKVKYASEQLKMLGYDVLRDKVKLVIYDSKLVNI